ncbi:hypothetical protein [Acidovorax phage AP1]|nr:hypothetical protein [Acidovorax phage AP1]
MEITEHQANMFRALADGKRMQVVDKKLVPNRAFDITTLDNFMLFIADNDRYEVRIKPDVIVVNGIEVPAPEKVAPKLGDVYYAPSPLMVSSCTEFTWCEDSEDRRFLECGLVHRCKEHAVAHCEAMLAHKPG